MSVSTGVHVDGVWAYTIPRTGRRAGGERLQSEADKGHAGTWQDRQRQDWACEWLRLWNGERGVQWTRVEQDCLSTQLVELVLLRNGLYHLLLVVFMSVGDGKDVSPHP